MMSEPVLPEPGQQPANAVPPNRDDPSLALPPAFRRQRLLVGVFVTAHVMLVCAGAFFDSATYCEPANLAAGIAYWEYGRTDLYVVNPPLARAVAAVPVLTCLHLNTDGITFPLVPGDRPEFAVGDALLRANADAYWWILILGRLPGLGWSLLGAWLVYRWAGQLFGPRGGLVGLAVWCLEPNVAAYAHLITQDIPCTVLTLAATYGFWRYLNGPSWTRAAVTGGLLGAALLTKFTAVLLVPILFAVWVASLRSLPSIAWRTRIGQYLALNAIALVVLNWGYGFEGTGAPLGAVPYVSCTFSGETVAPGGATPGNRFWGTRLAHVPSPFPMNYLRGIDLQKYDFEEYEISRPCYLRGEWKLGGWYYYYLYAMLVKVPIGTLALLAVGLPWWTASHRRYRAPDYLCVLLVSAALFGFVSFQKALNKHFRYVLPAFPGLVLTAAAAAGWAGTRHRRWLVIGSLLGFQAVSVAGQGLHTLGYFNELAGGPLQGWKHLSGSNVDWGQDLWWLKRWVDRHPGPQPLYLVCYGRQDPRVLGLDFALAPQGPGESPLPADAAAQKGMAPLPGRFAVSVLTLQGMAMWTPDGHGGYLPQPRFAHAYLKHFKPVAVAGTSIWIYDISLADANRVRELYGMVPLAPDDSR
jgi:hypothetical protein